MDSTLKPIVGIVESTVWVSTMVLSSCAIKVSQAKFTGSSLFYYCVHVPSLSFRLNKIVVFPAASKPTIIILRSLGEKTIVRNPTHERREKL